MELELPELKELEFMELEYLEWNSSSMNSSSMKGTRVPIYFILFILYFLSLITSYLILKKLNFKIGT